MYAVNNLCRTIHVPSIMGVTKGGWGCNPPSSFWVLSVKLRCRRKKMRKGGGKNEKERKENKTRKGKERKERIRNNKQKEKNSKRRKGKQKKGGGLKRGYRGGDKSLGEEGGINIERGFLGGVVEGARKIRIDVLLCWHSCSMIVYIYQCRSLKSLRCIMSFGRQIFPPTNCEFLSAVTTSRETKTIIFVFSRSLTFL